MPGSRRVRGQRVVAGQASRMPGQATGAAGVNLLVYLSHDHQSTSRQFDAKSGRRRVDPGIAANTPAFPPPSPVQQSHLIELSCLMYSRWVAVTNSRQALPLPPGVLRLTGHPVRWRLLTELARSDRQVRELVELIGQRQSLTSYHLGQLRDGGLVRVRRSSADKRDTYYSLDLAAYHEELAGAGSALHPGLRLVPAALTLPLASPDSQSRPPVRVLFLCTGNSSRSQMAEALLERLGGARVAAASAGSHPKPVHPNAVRVMRENGIDISGQHSKHLSVFADQRFDYVVSLCDRVREVCPQFPGSPEVTHWSMPDPSSEPAVDGSDYPPFVRTANELKTRIQYLLQAIDGAAAKVEEIQRSG
jgi:protein-tyrosine-phosphatase